MNNLVNTEGLNHLALAIFKFLDNKSLATCRQVNHTWKDLIESQKFFYARKLLKMVKENPDLFKFGNSQWFSIVEDLIENNEHELKDLKNMTTFLTLFFKAKSNYVKNGHQSPLEWIASKTSNDFKWAKWMEFCMKYLHTFGWYNIRKYPDSRTALKTAVYENNAPVLKLLLENGQGKEMDFEEPDANGFNPFIWACVRGGVEIVKLYLQYADKYPKEKYGWCEGIGMYFLLLEFDHPFFNSEITS